MLLYGFAKDPTIDKLLKMKEVTVAADPESLRALARFIDYVADEMDKHGERFGHEHMRDHPSAWKEGYPDIIITKPEE